MYNYYCNNYSRKNLNSNWFCRWSKFNINYYSRLQLNDTIWKLSQVKIAKNNFHYCKWFVQENSSEKSRLN